jgi:hypothetical protein
MIYGPVNFWRVRYSLIDLEATKSNNIHGAIYIVKCRELIKSYFSQNYTSG